MANIIINKDTVKNSITIDYNDLSSMVGVIKATGKVDNFKLPQLKLVVDDAAMGGATQAVELILPDSSVASILFGTVDDVKVDGVSLGAITDANDLFNKICTILELA